MTDNSTLLLVTLLAGLCPLSFLIGLSVGVIIWLVTRRQEYETESILNITPSQIPKIATLMLKAGYDVFTSHDEKVGTVNMVVKRKKGL